MYFDNFFVILSKTCNKIKFYWQWLTWVLHGFPYIASLSLNNHHTVQVKVCLLLHSMQIQDLAQSINISQSTKEYFIQNWTKSQTKGNEEKEEKKMSSFSPRIYVWFPILVSNLFSMYSHKFHHYWPHLGEIFLLEKIP